MMAWPVGVLGYLIGSISTARLIGRWKDPGSTLQGAEFSVHGTDETWVYRGVSATTAGKRYGARWGVVAAVLDGLKALVPVLVARSLTDDPWVPLAVSLGVIVGHVWPVYHRFVGGRGQSPIIGSLVALDPVSVPVVIVVMMLIGLSVFGSVYLARNGYPLLVAAWFLVTDGWGRTAWYGLAVSVVYLVAILPDLSEERRTRAASGISRMSWVARVATAWREMFDPRTE